MMPSPPHDAGTPEPKKRRPDIPTWAGSTYPTRWCAGDSRDHPSVRGNPPTAGATPGLQYPTTQAIQRRPAIQPIVSTPYVKHLGLHYRQQGSIHPTPPPTTTRKSPQASQEGSPRTPFSGRQQTGPLSPPPAAHFFGKLIKRNFDVQTETLLHIQ